MSGDIEKESAQIPESECLLGNEEVKVVAERRSERNSEGRREDGRAATIVVSEENGCVLDDDPPPYSAIVPPNHIGWPFDYQAAGIGYSSHNGPLCRADLNLALFQSCRPEGSSAATAAAATAAAATAAAATATVVQQASIAVPFTPYRLFKLGSHRSGTVPNTGLAAKYDTGKTRKYGAILMAGAVIIFLMALSLMVRFVVERSFWRG